MPMGFSPFSRRPFSTLIDLPLVATIAAGVNAIIIYTVEITPATGSPVYAATEQYATLISDSLPSVPFNATLEHAPRFKRSIKDGNGFGRMSSGFGDVTLNNASGEYDTLIASPFDGARVVCKLGWRGISYDRFITIFDGMVETADISEESVTLHIKDDNKRLEIPAQPSVYGGTGGIDGDSNVQGKRKPICLGLVRNGTAVLIDAVNLIYQYHDGQVFPMTPDTVNGVFDRRVYLQPNATLDYANYAALVAATITPGRMATCAALGLFRLGSKPDGLVTFTTQGAVSNGLVAGYPTAGTQMLDTASFVHYLITISGANIVVDTGSILSVAAAQPNRIGYFIGPDDNKTLRQAIDDLMDGIGGFAGFRADRTFNIGIFTLPTGAVVGDFTNKDWYGELTLPALPTIAKVPPKKFFGAYAQNWTPMPDVDATVDVAVVTLNKDSYAIAQSNDTGTSAAIIAAHPTSADSEIVQTWFIDSAVTVTELNRRLVLYGGAIRLLFRADLTEIAFQLDIGVVEKLTDSRFGISGGKSLTVVEIDNGFDEGVVSVEGFG